MINKLSIRVQELVKKTVSLRFRNYQEFKAPESLILYEQRLLDNQSLLEYTEQKCNVQFSAQEPTYLPSEIINFYYNKRCIPLKWDKVLNQIHVGTIQEFKDEYIEEYRNCEVVKHIIPIYKYVEWYTKDYNIPEFLYPLPTKDIVDFIIDEAISLEAADITISSRADKALVYYNVKKQKVYSRRSITKEQVTDICQWLAGSAGATKSEGDFTPNYFGVDLTPHYRGRVVIVHTYHGLSATIRVLPNDLFMQTMNELNLKENTQKFISEEFLDNEYGLRIIVGPTFSGKNTTMMAALAKKIEEQDCKAISVEMPVELLVNFMEQINCQTEEQYKEASISLLRQNPDIVYVTEMSEMTAMSIMKTSNTGKEVYTSLHANSIADVIPRLQDMTGLSIDRIILNLHSIIYQNLIRIDDEVLPINRCLRFSTELKDKLLGLSLGQVTKLVREKEALWEQ